MYEIINRSIKRLEKTKDIDQCNEELFGIYAYILLNKKAFKYNHDLKKFIDPLLKEINKYNKKDIVFKDYVYRSRSLIVARFIRIIENSDKNVKNILIKNLTCFSAKNHKNVKKESPKKKRKNSVDELLNRFERR